MDVRCVLGWDVVMWERRGRGEVKRPKKLCLHLVEEDQGVESVDPSQHLYAPMPQHVKNEIVGLLADAFVNEVQRNQSGANRVEPKGTGG